MISLENAKRLKELGVGGKNESRARFWINPKTGETQLLLPTLSQLLEEEKTRIPKGWTITMGWNGMYWWHQVEDGRTGEVRLGTSDDDCLDNAVALALIAILEVKDD